MAETGERSKHDVAADSRPELGWGWPETTKIFFQAQYTAQDVKSLAFRVFGPDVSFKIHIFDLVKFKRFFEKVTRETGATIETVLGPGFMTLFQGPK